uniref:Cyl-CoA synthetase long-chain family n=1 Tax=Nephromyces sp. MMRI TaxID=2496275 RepID=A0A3S5HLW9_9APIC|nr:cyl-CoA synthetase long-chain family [Nephromyces sp. MMRI]AZL94689.1 cyl-CoA synthetase long-chain family [Nephromyces sp. MMRI]AZL94690.1 cyl-CoA synthetase long-chain family [Nephromyces sp. MMRI]AZL94691.1 cyl-CoA synthetase long-chain family [Nephromyces sp. MMRI]AZL94694.1 cyl-CoA synthetase long-chain family [Nephromyces sp. MMRI]
MGNYHSSLNYVYSQPIGKSTSEDLTAAYRDVHSPELITNLEDNSINSCWDLFQRGKSFGEDRPCIGSREKNEAGELGGYVWKSFADVEKLVDNLGSGLYHMNLVDKVEFDDEPAAPSLRMLGLYSKNREEWFVCDQACGKYNIALIPLYDSLGKESTEYILDTCKLATLCVSEECAKKLLTEAESFKYLKNLIVFDWSEDIAKLAESKGVKLMRWSELLTIGESNPIAASDYEPTNLQSVNTICFTSGTTGNPKGALLTHGNMVSCVCSVIVGVMPYREVYVTKEEVILSYLPLAHIYERVVELLTFSCGGRVGFYSGDILKVVDDIKALKPTVFVSVPRLFIRINDRVLNNVSKKSSLINFLFHRALNAKVKSISEGKGWTNSLWDPIFFKFIKEMFGGRVRMVINGSAPLPPALQHNISAFLSAPVLEGYGMTETMGASFIGHMFELEKGTIGGPMPSLEFRLQSIPDMGYLVTNDPPRGELQMRGPSVISGYFRNPKDTAEAFTSDGWLKSGDIAEVGSRGYVKIIDRKKSMFKLSQGEYILPDKLEGIFCQVGIIDQILVTGLTTENCAVAIVVPNEELAKKWAASADVEADSLAKIASSPKFKEHVLQELETCGRASHLLGFELIKGVHFHLTPFTPEGGIVTPTFKFKRAHANKVFMNEILAIYEEVKAKSRQGRAD